MTSMTNPNDALVSFQASLLEENVLLPRCSQHQDLSFFEDSLRMTYAMIDHGNVVKALVSFAQVERFNGAHCFAIGYAVAEPFRCQGLSYDIVRKAIDEFTALSKGMVPCFYLEAIVGAGNLASQKVAGRFINDKPASIIDELSGLPALHYMRLLQ